MVPYGEIAKRLYHRNIFSQCGVLSSTTAKLFLWLCTQEDAMKKTIFLISLVLIAVLAFPLPARADGIIIPDPRPCDPMPCPGPIPLEQLAIRYHHVTVTIRDQVAVTHVDQVFYNPNDWQIEGTYIFPIPLDAVVTNFILWIDGTPVEGQVLDATQARQTYESIVATMRDPALLEYVGQGAVQARIFPIPPYGERRIELEYTQAMPAEGGLVRYVYPLNTERFSVLPLESVSVSVDIQSSVPIRATYSPSHDISVTRESDTHVRAGYEAANVLPDTDFALYYSLGETQAFHVLSYLDPSDATDPDGYFLLMLAPGIQEDSLPIPKDLILVLDHSGSMDGDKFRQAQAALDYMLSHLNQGDRFNIISFSTGTERYANTLRPATDASNARTWVNGLRAEGSTDINRALLEAADMVDTERPTYLIFLTDGLPTEGVTDSERILSNFAEAAAPDLRLFVFGVGYDVDTYLLDSLAQEQHGSSTYVLPEDRLDEILSSFYARISTPVLTGLELDFDGLSVFDLYPFPLPDLFAGSQVLVLGRYREGGRVDVTLSGEVNNQPRQFTFEAQYFSEESPEDAVLKAIPRLWATRKIGYLLNEIRLNGPNQELIDQIVRLSIRFGIVTPYTSYLVTESAPLGAVEQERIVQEQFNQSMTATPAPSYGQEAVKQASDEGELAGASSATSLSEEAANTVRIVGARAFVLSAGVWIDTAFDPDVMQTVPVVFLSDDYFTLVASQPELADAFALGERVIALSDGVAYEVVSADTAVQPLDLPPDEGSDLPVPTTPETEPDVATPVSPIPSAVPAGGEPEPTEPSTGPCAGGLIPLLLLPFLAVLVKKRDRG
jgi:Ca-activated chloride channel family protein